MADVTTTLGLNTTEIDTSLRDVSKLVSRFANRAKKVDALGDAFGKVAENLGKVSGAFANAQVSVAVTGLRALGASASGILGPIIDVGSATQGLTPIFGQAGDAAPLVTDVQAAERSGSKQILIGTL